MLDWLDGVAGPDYVRAILWTIVALVVLVIVLVVVRLVRSMTFGTFVAGGRNRKTRLAVMDATAIDSHRRLVLVRRDDIEHLLLIGGPTDVVVERDIRLVAPRRPVLTGGDVQHHPAAPQRPQPEQSPPARPAPPPPARPRESAVAPAPGPAAVSPRPPAAAHQAGHAFHARKADEKPTPVRDDVLDDTFVNDLEVSLDDFSANHRPVQPVATRAAPASPDDEMAKLLGELASHKK